MKVLHIFSGYGGGISSFIRNQASIISEEFLFDVMSFTDYPDDFKAIIARNGGRCFTMPRKATVGYYGLAKWVYVEIKKNKPYDRVVCHIDGHYSILFRFICRLLGLKDFIIHAHKAGDDKGSKGFRSRMMRHVDRLINNLVSTSKASCSAKASDYIFGTRDKVTHIPNSIDFERFQHGRTLRNELEIGPDEFVIGSIARFYYPKNHPFMIEILKELKERQLPFKMVFAGEGESRQKIEDLVKENELEDYVHFLGRIDRVEDVFETIDLLLLPSFYEGLPTVVVEAQGTCTPVLLSDTITREVDCGLNLLTYLPIDCSGKWVENILSIMENSKISKKLDAQALHQALHQNGFTNESSSLIYEGFLRGEIREYVIGEKIMRTEA